MSSQKIKEQIEKIEQQKKIELEKIEQLKRQQIAAKQKLRAVESTEKRKDDTKLKILMGAYLEKILKESPQTVQFHKTKFKAFCAAEKSEKARTKNLELADKFFNDLENKQDV